MDPPFVVFRERQRWILFQRPEAALAIHHPAHLPELLRRLDRALEDHRYVAGYIGYDATAGLSLAAQRPLASALPLAWFGVFQRVEDLPVAPVPEASAEGTWEPLLTQTAYLAGFRRIQEYIAAGDTYQVNFTFPLIQRFRGDAWAAFRRLAAVQSAAHAAYVDLGQFAVLSASPELFFWADGPRVTMKPMKGTAARGPSPKSDEANSRVLTTSVKTRAENVMIVDMLRSDLGRAAVPGSVAVPRLFEVERYPTLLQMTSTVVAESKASLGSLLTHLLAPASVTGAPKRRTMEIIAELEPCPRGIYTGTLGWAGPGGTARFNVAIRTSVVDRAAATARFGVGSGIVADSVGPDEYDECLLKARILTEAPFELLETMRAEPGKGILYLDEHLLRLEASAAYWGVRWDKPAARAALLAETESILETKRVRLLVDLDGAFRVETAALEAPRGTARVAFAEAPVLSTSPWLRFKTTRRDVYQRARAGRPDVDDVLLWNEHNDITEVTTANVVVEIGGTLITPRSEAGLLPGILRGRLLDCGTVREGPVQRRDLHAGQRIFLVSALRGWREAVLV